MSKRKWKALKAASDGSKKRVRGDGGDGSEEGGGPAPAAGVVQTQAQVSVFDLISLQRMWVSYVQMTAMNKYIDSVAGLSGGRAAAAASVSMGQLQSKLGTVTLVGAFVQVLQAVDAAHVGVHGYVTRESANCYHLTRVEFDAGAEVAGEPGVDPNTQLLSVALLDHNADRYRVSTLVLVKRLCSIGIMLPTSASGGGAGAGAVNSLDESAALAFIVRGKEFYPFCKERTGGAV
jgi:hypothetical protein